MFSKEFEAVYQQAFTSATGRDFASEEVQSEHKEKTTVTADALLDRWTDPNFDSSSITDERSSRQSVTFRIKHPSTAEFTEEDAWDIAHVRYLGQAILAAAQQSLTDNRYMDPANRNRFRGIEWHRAHPKVEDLEELAYDTEAPSPQRLREWPRGDYMNCLGISIAISAESTNNGIPFVYTNRIRDAKHEGANITAKFFERIIRAAPTAIELDDMLHHVDLVEAAYTTKRKDERLDKRLAELDYCVRGERTLGQIYSYVDSLETAFHHSIIQKREGDSILSDWFQFDPFQLVDSHMGPHLLDQTLTQDERLFDDGACNEILFLDGDMQDHQSRKLGKIIDTAIRGRERLRVILEDYKSGDYLKRVEDEVRKCMNAMEICQFMGENESIANISDQDLFERGSLFGKHIDDGFRFVWMEILRETASNRKNQQAAKAWDIAAKKVIGSEKLKGVTYDKLLDKNQDDIMSLAMQEVIRRDGATRARFTKIIENMPFGFALHSGEQTIENLMFRGDVDKSFEVGDPAFMIGSFYMNHFARWQEDGIVNVAKELARVNPSQLIWQSAVSHEQGVVTDDRIAAVGALVKSLKIGQQHPLVRITQVRSGTDGREKEEGAEAFQGEGR